MIKRLLNALLMRGMNFERRWIDPYVRPVVDPIVQKPLGDLIQLANNARRQDHHLALAEEEHVPGEEELTAQIVEAQSRFTTETYTGNLPALRVGNTKTYGVVRAELEILPGLSPRLRHGLFATPATYRAWVRFGGPGPLAPPDVRDNGLLSIGIKVMGVDGPKLLEDEKHTQDFTGLSAPIFTTPNVVENLKLQRNVVAGTPIFYFLQPGNSHLLDALMQGLYAKTQVNPLEERYWSTVPYLLGDGQAMQYSVRPCSPGRTRFPSPPPDDYLKEAMARTLRTRAVAFDFMVQLQTDSFRMPIEDASVSWPESLSPYVTVARLHIPVQEFDSPGQLAFVHNLSYNPWHSLPEHRPLGNQGRARRTIYYEMSKFRQAMSGTPHVEPTGDEVFE